MDEVEFLAINSDRRRSLQPNKRFSLFLRLVSLQIYIQCRTTSYCHLQKKHRKRIKFIVHYYCQFRCHMHFCSETRHRESENLSFGCKERLLSEFIAKKSTSSIFQMFLLAYSTKTMFSCYYNSIDSVAF